MPDINITLKFDIDEYELNTQQMYSYSDYWEFKCKIYNVEILSNKRYKTKVGALCADKRFLKKHNRVVEMLCMKAPYLHLVKLT